LSQTLKFKAPVRIGDTVRARATVLGVDMEKCRATLQTVAEVGAIIVVEGEALVMVPRRPAA
jgi:3-hydroxybutyryl-CoA dehydratase